MEGSKLLPQMVQICTSESSNYFTMHPSQFHTSESSNYFTMHPSQVHTSESSNYFTIHPSQVHTSESSDYFTMHPSQVHTSESSDYFTIHPSQRGDAPFHLFPQLRRLQHQGVSAEGEEPGQNLHLTPRLE